MTRSFAAAAFALALLLAPIGVTGQDRPALPPGALERAVQSSWPNVPAELRARLDQDETLKVCSEHRNRPPQAVADAVAARERARIVLPASGRLMGDWRRGEQGALSGYGLRMGDNDPRRQNGGNCYACHALAPSEISFGTLGPPLTGYGKLRGAEPQTQREVYERIFNIQASVPCSNMPRFGANGVLTPEQIADYVAFLLDPESPVNR
jgi:sulfur-oxidizing protein SoxX